MISTRTSGRDVRDDPARLALASARPEGLTAQIATACDGKRRAR